MSAPLPLIEFAVFIGLVIYLFTLPSSPLRKDSASKEQADDSAGGDATAATGETERKDSAQG
jgi:hypothetical protein